MTKIELWDGLTPSRQTLNDTKHPDHSDYLVLVTKIQQLQNALNTATGNLALMPDMEEKLLDVEKRIEQFKARIKNLTPPEDINARLETLKEDLIAQDTCKDTLLLKKTAEELSSQIAQNKLELLELKSLFSVEVTAFQNKVWHAFKQLDQDIRDRMDSVEKKLESVSIQTRLQTLLEELRK